MFSISVKHDLDKLRLALRNDQKQVRYAMSQALNAVAKDVKEEMPREMRRVFDRPTPWTLNSLRIIFATKARLTAMVWVKDEPGNDASRYLNPEIAGGPRRHKAFEMRLIRQGLMPADQFAVPGRGARLDSYGNIMGGEIERILSALGAAEQWSGYQANRTQRSKKRLGKNRRDFFVGTPGGKAPLGVWERKRDGSIKPVLIFVRKPVYRRRLDFNAVGLRVMDRQWTLRLSQALSKTLRTARFAGANRMAA